MNPSKNENQNNFHDKNSEIITYPNGNKYHGLIINGNKSGKGILYFVNGNRYDGDWKNSKM